MTTIWVCIVVTAMVSFAIKAMGPMALGRRPLPVAARDVVTLLAPVLLCALLVAELVGPDWSSVDRGLLAGVAAAATARLWGLPPMVCVCCAVAVTALVRGVA